MSAYHSLKYLTPEALRDKAPNGKILVLCNGPSTNNILPHKYKLKDKFDIIITVNHGFFEFDDVADYHLVTEKTCPTNNVPNMLAEKQYNRDTIRIINHKGLETYPKGYNYYKVTRSNFGGSPDIRKYKVGEDEGLLIGKTNARKMSTGSVALQALHFACILGAAKVYFIGIDFLFRDEFDHFYKDSQYRTDQVKLKPGNRVHIVSVEKDGKSYKTTDYFRDSALYLNEAIPTLFKDIRIFDFSDGLVTAAEQLNVEDFFD